MLEFEQRRSDAHTLIVYGDQDLDPACMTLLKLETCTVDLSNGGITPRGDAPVESGSLPARALDLLKLLIARAGEVVARDDILESVWGHVEAGSDDALNVAVSGLRKSLGDHDRPNRYIRTIPRRGYTWIGPLPEGDEEDPGDVVKNQWIGAPRFIAGLAILVLGVLVLALIWPEPDPKPVIVENPNAADPFVAVLPFKDFSDGGDDSAFANGLTDRILHALAQVEGLKVGARTTAYALEAQGLSIREIGQRLGATVVLEGSVQRSGDDVRVLAQLIDPDDERHIWSRSYERSAGDVFIIQDAISEAVASAMKRTLLPQEAEDVDLQVFEQIARGRASLDRGTARDVQRAIVILDEVTTRAPDVSDGWVFLSDALRAEARLAGASEVTDPRYVQALQRAQNLKPNGPRVLRARADSLLYTDRREEAADLYRAAIAASPSYAEAHAGLGRTHFFEGQFDEALTHLRNAHELDPLNDQVASWLADAFWSVGRAEEALARLREAIRENPSFPEYRERLATYLNQLGQTGEAMLQIVRLRDLDPMSPLRWQRTCEFYLQIGDPDGAENCTDEMVAQFDVPQLELYMAQCPVRCNMPPLRSLNRGPIPQAILVPPAITRRNFCETALVATRTGRPLDTCA